MGLREGLIDALGPALEAWLQPAWSTLSPLFAPGRDAVLLAAACRLGDIGARLHPDHRAELVFERVLRAPIAGQTHPERAYLATALFARHSSSLPEPVGRLALRLLGDERLARARALGAALRLGCDLSGRSPALLAATGLTLAGRTPDPVDARIGRGPAPGRTNPQTPGRRGRHAGRGRQDGDNWIDTLPVEGEVLGSARLARRDLDHFHRGPRQHQGKLASLETQGVSTEHVASPSVQRTDRSRIVAGDLFQIADREAINLEAHACVLGHEPSEAP